MNDIEYKNIEHLSDDRKRIIEYQLKLLSDKSCGINLYKVTADYNKYNTHHPEYYIFARNIREAKSRFKNFLPWLHIYECKVCDDETAMHVVSCPLNHITR